MHILHPSCPSPAPAASWLCVYWGRQWVETGLSQSWQVCFLFFSRLSFREAMWLSPEQESLHGNLLGVFLAKLLLPSERGDVVGATFLSMSSPREASCEVQHFSSNFVTMRQQMWTVRGTRGMRPWLSHWTNPQTQLPPDSLCEKMNKSLFV